MSIFLRAFLPVLFLWLSAAGAVAAPPQTAAPRTLTVGVVQMALEPTLEGNRDKIVRFIGEAASKGCRVVVFPESALSWPENTPKTTIDAAIAAIQNAAKARSIYAIFCAIYKRTENDPPFNWLLVVSPTGEIIHRYHKLWSDRRSNNVPGLFYLDGVPCAGIICADRWIRGVEDLPAAAGAKILFELSCNFADEWVPELGWYWYVPRALRNNVYVIFANTAPSPSIPKEGRHGHSAIIAPDGSFLAAAQTEPDRLLTAALDLTQATGEEAMRRRHHPLFRAFWETGLTIMNGGTVEVPEFQPFQSPAAKVKLAAVQMTSTDNIAANLTKMKERMREAKANGADAVIFPELAVTGPSAAAVSAARAKELDAALRQLQEAARAEHICVIFGMPWMEKNRRRNCAVVLDSEGKVLTRHAQLVVDRPDLFAAGTQTRSMWFRIKGVPAVVTLGRREALWSEIAELAAVRGAQIHIHLSYDTDTTTQAALLRRQLYVNLASFNTFAATVNATGETALWEDFRRDRKRTPTGYGFYCARVLARAGEGEQIIYAEQTVSRTNPHFARITGNTNPQMKDWFEMGARAIDAEAPPRRTASSPYPPSPVIRGIEWAPPSTIVRRAEGGDNWPVTWADDDAIYTTWGDGWGFEPKVPEKLSLGFARLTGPPERFVGENIRSPAEQKGQGRAGRKGWGILCVAGVLYLWMGHADLQGGQSQLAWSRDHARTWTFADWTFAEFGLLGFVNYGKDYAGARDNYVYAYGHDGPKADTPADQFILMRAPKDRIAERAAWEFFERLDADGRPVWTRDIARRGPIFTHPDSCLRSAMTYNPGLRRYLWWQQIPAPAGSHDRGDTRFEGGFGIYDAPEPWGPWSTVYFTERWDVGPGEHADFPAKWMSADGMDLWLVFSGEDSFSVRKATLLTAPPRAQTGE